MSVRQHLRLAFWGAGGTVSLVLGIGLLVFAGVGLVDMATSRGPSGKDEILAPLFLALGAILLWIGVRELLRLRRALRRKRLNQS